MSIGKKIQEMRLQKGLSQEAVENLSGIKRTNLSAYENGHNTPGLTVIQKLATVFQVPISSLLEGESEGGQKPSAFIQGLREHEIKQEMKALDELFSKLVEINMQQAKTLKEFQMKMKKKLGLSKDLAENHGAAKIQHNPTVESNVSHRQKRRAK